MKTVMPFYNFIMFLVVGTFFICVVIFLNDAYINNLLRTGKADIILTNNMISVITFISVAYICGYIISRLGSALDTIFNCMAYCIDKCKCKVLPSKLYHWACKLYRWDDCSLVEKAKNYDILYTYAREYSFCRTVATMFLLLTIIAYRNPCNEFACMFFIFFLILLFATCKSVYKVNNLLDKI